MSHRVLTAIVTASCLVWPLASASAAAFESWAAMIVAGDSRAHSGAPSPVFDNGRRDLAAALGRMGFTPGRILQFSTQPGRDASDTPLRSEFDTIRASFLRSAQQSVGGCFVYLTSHGSPDGILIGDSIVSPATIGQMINQACNDRITIAIISACYSGVFIPALRSENRMILTAARPDRTSFGCGEANEYTFFDQCVLESLAQSSNFPRLARAVQLCVAAREMAEGMTPPSEPQVYVGANIAPALQAYVFSAN